MDGRDEASLLSAGQHIPGQCEWRWDGVSGESGCLPRWAAMSARAELVDMSASPPTSRLTIWPLLKLVASPTAVTPPICPFCLTKRLTPLARASCLLGRGLLGRGLLGRGGIVLLGRGGFARLAVPGTARGRRGWRARSGTARRRRGRLTVTGAARGRCGRLATARSRVVAVRRFALLARVATLVARLRLGITLRGQHTDPVTSPRTGAGARLRCRRVIQLLEVGTVRRRAQGRAQRPEDAPRSRRHDRSDGRRPAGVSHRPSGRLERPEERQRCGRWLRSRCDHSNDRGAVLQGNLFSFGAWPRGSTHRLGPRLRDRIAERTSAQHKGERGGQHRQPRTRSLHPRVHRVVPPYAPAPHGLISPISAAFTRSTRPARRVRCSGPGPGIRAPTRCTGQAPRAHVPRRRPPACLASSPPPRALEAFWLGGVVRKPNQWCEPLLSAVAFQLCACEHLTSYESYEVRAGTSLG